MGAKSAATTNHQRRVDRPRPVARPAAGPEEEIDRPSLIELRYGDVVEILTEMGFRGSTSERAFNDYLKSLRKLDLPVSRRNARRRGHMIMYSYENVMDLVLAMILRVYHAVPDAVLRGLVSSKEDLHPIYRLAYEQRTSGMGARFRVGRHTDVTGVYLDLRLDHASGRLISFGPPLALSPEQAIVQFAQADVAARAFVPIHLSYFAEKVVDLALEQMRRRAAA